LGLRQPAVLVGSFDRPNLNYQIVPRDDAGRQLLDILARHRGEASIVYCISRKETEDTSAFLRSKGVKAAAYHAGMTAAERSRTQETFAAERLDVIVATVAFGMGIDRSNVRCVVHAAMPKSVEHYQQETGRAGRDGLEAECVMLYSRSDTRRWSFIMEQAGTAPEVLQAQKALLHDMRRICETPVCRHAALSRYFGQRYEKENCGACDVCAPQAAEAAALGSPLDGWRGVDRALFERLRDLRKTIAGERGAPAYIIFSDETLRDLARSRPLTLTEMKRVKGIGDRKLADLGQRFLVEIRDHCREEGGTAQPRLAGAAGATLTRRRAFDLFREGKPVAEVADAIGRALSTTLQYLVEWVQETAPADVSAWVPAERYRRVEAAVNEVGLGLLRPVFEALDGEVPYDDIRVVVAHLRALNRAR